MERGDQKLKRRRDEGLRISVAPLSLLIKEQGGGSAAPLNQSRRRKSRRLGPTRCLDPRRPGFLPPPPRPQVHGGHVAGAQSRGDGGGDLSPPRDHGERTPRKPCLGPVR